MKIQKSFSSVKTIFVVMVSLSLTVIAGDVPYRYEPYAENRVKAYLPRADQCPGYGSFFPGTAFVPVNYPVLTSVRVGHPPAYVPFGSNTQQLDGDDDQALSAQTQSSRSSSLSSRGFTAVTEPACHGQQAATSGVMSTVPALVMDTSDLQVAPVGGVKKLERPVNDIQRAEFKLREINKHVRNVLRKQLEDQTVAAKQSCERELTELRRQQMVQRKKLDLALAQHQKGQLNPVVAAAACGATQPRVMPCGRTTVSSVGTQIDSDNARIGDLQQQLEQRDKSLRALQLKVNQYANDKRVMADVACQREQFLKERNEVTLEKARLEENLGRLTHEVNKMKTELVEVRRQYAECGHKSKDAQKESARKLDILQQQYDACDRHRVSVEQYLSASYEQLKRYHALERSRNELPCSCRGVAYVAAAMMGVWTVFAHWDLYTSCR